MKFPQSNCFHSIKQSATSYTTTSFSELAWNWLLAVVKLFKYIDLILINQGWNYSVLLKDISLPVTNICAQRSLLH
jgi:hypothetical protein